jgi:hypothetical protein
MLLRLGISMTSLCVHAISAATDVVNNGVEALVTLWLNNPAGDLHGRRKRWDFRQSHV